MRVTYKYQLESDHELQRAEVYIERRSRGLERLKKITPNMISFLKLFLKYTEFRRLVDYRLKSCSCVCVGGGKIIRDIYVSNHNHT